MTLLGRRLLEVTWASEPETCTLSAVHHWHVRFDLALGRIEAWRRWCCHCATTQVAQKLGDALDARVPDPECGPFAGSMHGPLPDD